MWAHTSLKHQILHLYANSTEQTRVQWNERDFTLWRNYRHKKFQSNIRDRATLPVLKTTYNSCSALVSSDASSLTPITVYCCVSLHLFFLSSFPFHSDVCPPMIFLNEISQCRNRFHSQEKFIRSIWFWLFLQFASMLDFGSVLKQHVSMLPLDLVLQECSGRRQHFELKDSF